MLYEIKACYCFWAFIAIATEKILFNSHWVACVLALAESLTHILYSDT